MYSRGCPPDKPTMTNTPAISWGELWGIYRRSPAHYQQEILAQIDLPDILKYSSKKVIAEVMDEAPEELKPQHITIIPTAILEWERRWGRRWKGRR